MMEDEEEYVMDCGVDSSINGSVLSSNGLEGSQSVSDSFSASDAKVFIEGLDSYWDELNTRLTVSRMVNDAVVKGMVYGVAEDAAEQICSKETEMAVLTEKLHKYESDAFKSSDQQWRCDFQKEVDSIIVQNYIKGYLEESVAKLFKDRHICVVQNKNKIFKELASLREELDTLNKSLFQSDPAYQLCHGNHENNGDWHVVDRKDVVSRKGSGNHSSLYPVHTLENGAATTTSKTSVMEVADVSSLSHMSKEELVNFFRTEIMKMKRNHELALHEKTEELFIAKRELLKEKGSTPLNFKKEKEFEILRKKFPEFVQKLDTIIGMDTTFPVALDDCYKLCDLKDCNDNLIRENQHLKDLLSDKSKDIKCLSSQVSDAASQMSNHFCTETKSLKKIRELKAHIKDLEMIDLLKDEIQNIVIGELFTEIKCSMEVQGMEINFNHEIYSTMLKGFLEDSRSATNSLMNKCDEENRLVETIIVQKDAMLATETRKTEELKNKVESLSQLTATKEKHAEDTEFKLMQQNEHIEFMSQQLHLYKDKVAKQEALLSQNTRDLDLFSSRLKEAGVQVKHYREELRKGDDVLNIAVSRLMEVDIQKIVLHESVEGNQKILQKLVSQKKDDKEVMKSFIFSLLKLSQASQDFESCMTEQIQKNNARLENLRSQQDTIFKQVHRLQREKSCYKKSLELKSSNLLKAEKEVDLLGDEVDALLSVLMKSYIALDHYSPVLQHYPGVMEILELVRRELEGNAKPIADQASLMLKLR